MRENVIGSIFRNKYMDFVSVCNDGSVSEMDSSFVGSSFYIPDSNFQFSVAFQDFPRLIQRKRVLYCRIFFTPRE